MVRIQKIINNLKKGVLGMFSKRIAGLVCASVLGLLSLTGCSDNPTTPNISSGSTKLFICESDFQFGLLEWKLTSETNVSSSNLSIYSDAGIKAFGGYLYVIEHYGADNILKFDPSKSDQSGVVYQSHLGDNWNPQDIEFLSDTKAYVSNMNHPKITIFNPSSGKVISHIDISAYTFMPDSNSSPYACDLLLVGSDLYVLLQRRNGYNPGAPSLILKINTTTDVVVDTIPLQFRNGSGMAYADGVLYVSNQGNSYSIGDGAIEKVDLSTKAVSTVIDETTLGGNPNQIVYKSSSRFYITNYIEWKNTKVMEIDVATGKVVATLPGVKDAFGGICYDDVEGMLYVCERDANEMGVRVFKDNVQVGSIIRSSNSLPPTGMVIVR
jgi:hypothetical protein